MTVSPALPSTMMDDFPLTVQMLLRHGRTVHAASSVSTWDGTKSRTVSFATTAARVEKLAGALRGLGVQAGDRVGSFLWNNQEHIEAYFAVPSMGAVLHTLNLRLFPEQLAYVINDAADKVIIVDESLVPLLAKVAADLETVEHFVVTGSGDGAGLDVRGASVHSYKALTEAAPSVFPWPEISERSAAAMCYTTGTTGQPKGVVYSHRSIVLHSFGCLTPAAIPLTVNDRALVIVPQFHAMAWGLPYTAWMAGCDLLLPDKNLHAAALAQLIVAERATYAAAVPTIFNDLLRYSDEHETDLSSLRFTTCGGAALPRSVIDGFARKHGVPIIQGWGMTEMSPAGAVAWPPRGVAGEDANAWYAKSGRIIPGVELRIVDERGDELPWDGQAVGEIEVRGPWVTARYYKDDAPEKFHDGWLKTGDIASVESAGFVQITDRAKDIIKSGGEWISSVALENALMAHSSVAEAAVIAVPDEKWTERPLACVVARSGATPRPEDLKNFLADRVPKWWLPERWCLIDAIPKTSVGKFDKKQLRERHARNELDVILE